MPNFLLHNLFNIVPIFFNDEQTKHLHVLGIKQIVETLKFTDLYQVLHTKHEFS